MKDKKVSTHSPTLADNDQKPKRNYTIAPGVQYKGLYRKRARIGTRSGNHFDFERPSTYDIKADDLIKEIAYALCNIKRFTGHTNYSVAQHSFMVSMYLPTQDALMGLMHDAHEAYVGDVSGPLKSLLPDYRKLEEEVALALRTRFGLPVIVPHLVDHIDKRMGLTEAIYFGLPTDDYRADLEPIAGIGKDALRPISESKMMALFLTRFKELTAQHINKD